MVESVDTTDLKSVALEVWGFKSPRSYQMKIGDLVVTKTHRHVGCIIDIKKQKWAGICAKVLFFKSGIQKWRKLDNLEPFDKGSKE